MTCRNEKGPAIPKMLGLSDCALASGGLQFVLPEHAVEVDDLRVTIQEDVDHGSSLTPTVLRSPAVGGVNGTKLLPR